MVDGLGNKGVDVLLTVVMITSRRTKKNLIYIGSEEVKKLMFITGGSH